MQRVLVTIIVAVFSTQALAHHPLGGMPMETFAHGLLSGIGHPLLGFDHLFFITLVGIASIFTFYRLLAPLAYILAMLGGCLVSSLWIPVPAAEVVIALSLLVLGSMLLSGRHFDSTTLLLVFAGFGLFHGGAFGASLASQEAGIGVQVLAGYLLGLGVVQYGMALTSGWFCATVWKVSEANAIQPRLAGAMVAGAGLYLILEHLEGPLLRAIAS
jgi:urease accessory protein